MTKLVPDAHLMFFMMTFLRTAEKRALGTLEMPGRA